MHTIQKYVAEDGSEFAHADRCLAHESLCKEVAEIMATLPRRPVDADCKFSNGHGYLQHADETFWPARDALLRVANRLMPHKWFEQTLADRSIHSSWAGRAIDEMSKPLRSAWQRFMCVDEQLREWGQPYYALNPGAAEQVELPPGR